MRKLLSSFLSFLIWSSVLLAAAETDPVLIVVDKSDIVSYMTATYDYRSIKDRPAVIAVKTGESSATEADIKAKFDNGILKISVPKIEAKPEVEQNHYVAIEG